ncbi:Asp23/Gls24 family envelope stress response protein [Miniphocaeibacter halophilus]|uniref:Asp23/Gls24 family envelope stress response protein n=1 Tax=Miniphocaeibacter halophilus TaxID=2931922 RepID=A0AC61MQ83_9FIRM|nr:Asp23/Gls24 family envelope stress response protein [Miniphocaeibacter halophilus]QQK07750.1 Asp23/Gls24 family envelope stress response protein [Miniphocaeibacter halophilus]
MSAHIINELGVIQISDNVISKAISDVAMQSYGVVGLVSASATDSLLTLLGKDNITKGVVLNIKNNKMTIDLHVILEYGVKISVVTENLIDAIKFHVEEHTGIEVEKVNIIVRDIRLQNQEEI